MYRSPAPMSNHQQGVVSIAPRSGGPGNEILPMSSHAGLTDLILLAERDIACLETKIQHARVIYEGLLSQHASRALQLTQYQFVAATRNVLPPELLTEIFLFCIDGPTTLPAKHVSTPWNLCHVCSRWRAIALNTAALWKDIRVDFTPLLESEYNRLVDLTTRCFSWARNSQISLRVLAPEAPFQEELRNLLIKLLFHDAKKFEHISINHTESLTPLLWNRQLRFDALKSVSLTFTTPEFLDFPDTQYHGVSIFRQARLLQSFTLTAQKDTFDLCLFPIPWAQLTVLNLIGVIFPLQAGYKVLRQCTNLVSCRFSVTKDKDYMVQLLVSEEDILLRNLESLKIVAEHPGTYGTFLTRLNFPSLKYLEIKSRRDAHWTDSDISSFLWRSRCSLERLSAEFISPYNIHTLLEGSPDLRQLSLPESYIPHSAITQMMSYQLVPKLDSLSCAAYFLGDVTTLLDARWLAGHTSGRAAITNAVLICGKNYRHRFSKDAWLLLDQLRREGMNIVVKNRDGNLLSYDGDDKDD